MKWLRRGAAFIAVILAVPLVLLAVALGAVQLPPVQAWLAGKVHDLTAGTDSEVQITGLSGGLPFSPRIDRLTIADRKGVWLEADALRLQLAWTELFRGRVHVEEVGADRVAVLRTPVSTAPAPPPEPFALPDPASLPTSLPSILIDRLQVDRIELAEPVLGEPAVLALTGAVATDNGTRLNTRLDLRRIDQATLNLNLASVADLAARRLNVDLVGSETGGLVGRLAGMPQAGDLKLDLHGLGPFDDWQGKLAVSLARVADADADLRLGITDRARAGIDAVVRPADGLLPADIAPLVGPAPTLGLDAEVAQDGSLTVERLAARLAAATLSGSLQIPANEGALGGSLVADVPDLAPMSKLAAAALQGKVQATLSLAGTRERPEAKLDLVGDRLAMDRYRLDQLAAGLDVTATSALGETLNGADFRLETRATGLDLADATLPSEGPITLDAAGSANRDGRVRIATLKAAGLGATLDGQADLDTEHLKGDATLVGAVPALASLAPLLPEPWRQLDGQARLDLKLASTAAGEGDADSGLNLEISGLDGIPPDFRPILGDHVTVQADAVIDDGRKVTLDRFAASTQAVSLNGKGALDLDGGPLDLQLDGGMGDLGALAGLAGLPLAGRADLALRADGTLQAPNGTLSLQVAELGGLPEDLAALLGTSPSLDAKAARAADGTLALQELALQTATAQISGNGRYQPSDGAITAELNGEAADLAFLGRWLGGEPKGQAKLAVNATGTVEQPAATLSLRADGLAGLPAKFAELAGEAVTLDAQATVVPAEAGAGRVARLSSLELHSGAASVTGKGAFGLDDRALQAEIRARMPDLAKASAAASTELAGSLGLDATVGGTLDRPTAELHLAGQDIEAAGRPLGKVTADLNAQDLIAAPDGTLALVVMAETTPLTLKTGFRKDAALVALRDLQLRGPGGTALDGGLTVDTAKPTIRGKLEGGVRDLGGLQPLVGQALAGSLRLALSAEDASGQAAKATVSGSRIALPGVIDVGALDLNANITDLMGTPRLGSTLVAQDVTRQDVDLGRTTLRANGPLDALDVTLATSGRAYYPVTLDAATTIRRSGETVRIDLTRLTGSLAEKPLRLQKTARVELGPNRTVLSDLDLRYDQAQLAGSATLAGQRAEGALRLRDLQLASLGTFGAPSLQGTLAADIGLAGSTSAPQITIGATGRGLAVQGMAGSPNMPLDLDLDAKATGERASGRLALSGLGEQPLELTVDAPLRLALQPFAVALPEDGRIGGSLNGRLDLAQIARFAALDGQRVAGGLVSDLRFSGTLAQPQANGSLELRKVDFADTTSGVALRNLDLTVRANGQRIAIEQLTATDGGSGRLNGTGQANLGNPDLPFNVSLKIDDFSPIYRDDLLVRLGGTVDVRGDKAAAEVKGRIRVDRAEIAIPDGGDGGGTIPVIEVTDEGVEPAAGPETQAAAPYRVNLDIVVEMPERIFVRGRGLDSEWGGQVKVAGTASEPLVTGRIEVKRGFVNFLDRRFNITTGIVTLDGAVPPDPELNLEASFEANTLTGILKVTGRASDPTLELTSDPVRPQDEIMAQILFGRDVTKITPVQGIQLAAALNTLRGGGGGGILDTVRKNLGIDTLDFGGEGAGDASVKAGKYLSDDVYLQVERGVAPGTGKATVEVEVVPNVTVQTEVTEDSQTGFGVQWKYDY